MVPMGMMVRMGLVRRMRLIRLMGLRGRGCWRLSEGVAKELRCGGGLYLWWLPRRGRLPLQGAGGAAWLGRLGITWAQVLRTAECEGVPNSWDHEHRLLRASSLPLDHLIQCYPQLFLCLRSVDLEAISGSSYWLRLLCFPGKAHREATRRRHGIGGHRVAHTGYRLHGARSAPQSVQT